MKKNSIKELIIVFMFIVLEEIIFSFLTYKNFNVYMILFSFNISILIYIMYKIINNKTFIYVTFSIIIFLFLINYIYFYNYSNFITFDILFKSLSVLNFTNNIITIIGKNILQVILILIPYIFSIIIFYKRISVVKERLVIPIISFICSYIIAITCILLFSNNSVYSIKSLYFDVNFPLKNLYNFGLLTSIRIDIQRSVFGFKEKSSMVEANNNLYSSSKYNVLDINFINNDTEDINEISEYLKMSIPSKKNLYTGLLNGKNLIFIVAESFNTIAISENITPNLYKLFNEGFTFDNYYSPLYPVSTADGQYLIDESLFPSDSVHSLIEVNNNYLPYSLANMFSSINYKTYSYHNYYYNYYDRDKYYKNIGFDVYKAINNGLDVEIYDRSDYDMAVKTIDEYINNDKFFAYYLTMSGHAAYNESNKIALKNYDLLEDYSYSNGVKYYLSTQIELDKMLGLLFKKLEEYNKLNDIVIVLVPDHNPFGLTIDEVNELTDKNVDNEFEKYRSGFVIYNNDINKYKSNDNYCSNIDVLPTLLNAFGFEYDSRLLMGRDALSNNEGMVIFGNRNIVTKTYKYSNITDTLYGNENGLDIEKIKNKMYLNHKISRLILENDYYKKLFNKN